MQAAAGSLVEISSMTANKKESQWEFITLAAAAMLMITMGARQSLGLFVAPLNTATGLGIMTISFAMAVGQLKVGQQHFWRTLRQTCARLGERAGRPDLVSGLGQRVLQPPKRRRVVLEQHDRDGLHFRLIVQ